MLQNCPGQKCNKMLQKCLKQKCNKWDFMMENTRVVYSTDKGNLCPHCARAVKECVCRSQAITPKSDGIVRVSRQTQGRKGKTVTIISGLSLNNAGLEKLAKELKRKCGAGGTVDRGVIEIQGEHRDFLVKELERSGYRSRKV
jgi:translation initiation factor 1